MVPPSTRLLLLCRVTHGWSLLPSNSIRSIDPSVRSAGDDSRNGAHSAELSLRNIEEVAPLYMYGISACE